MRRRQSSCSPWRGRPCGIITGNDLQSLMFSRQGASKGATGNQMKRREFISGLGVAATWRLAAVAQQGERTGRVGMLIASDEREPLVRSRVAAFRQGLKDLGWFEGRNLQIEYRWTGNDPERTARYVLQLVALAPDVILAHSPPATLALSKA